MKLKKVILKEDKYFCPHCKNEIEELCYFYELRQKGTSDPRGDNPEYQSEEIDYSEHHCSLCGGEVIPHGWF